MDLLAYQRAYFSTYIRPIVIKNVCEKCGVTSDLHVHHNKQFVKQVEEILDLLGINKGLNTDQYSKEELTIITNCLFGIQIRNGFTTVCPICHRKLHIEFEIRSKDSALKTTGPIDVVMKRKGSDRRHLTDPQKVLIWYFDRTPGTVFKIEDMRSDLHMSMDSFKSAKQNSVVSKVLSVSRIDKKGYCVVKPREEIEEYLRSA